MKKILLFSLMAAVCQWLPVSAQQVTKSRICPLILLQAPRSVDTTKQENITVSVKPFSKAFKDLQATYNWTVTAGIISSGQGTSTVIVDIIGVRSPSVTANVAVGGLDPACKNTKSIKVRLAGARMK